MPRDRTIWIARHASRLDFEDPTWARTAAAPEDPPLSPRGRAEARRLAARLAGEPIAHVFSSPFRRALETAEPAAAARDLPLRVEAGLSEWLHPGWFAEPPRLLSPGERARRHPRADPGYAPHGAARHGETGEEALERAGATARALVAAFAGDLLLVGHGASVLGAALGLLGIPAADAPGPLPEPPCAGLVVIAWRGRWELVRRADVAHLEESAGSEGP